VRLRQESKISRLCGSTEESTLVAVQNSVTAILHRPEAITKLVPRVYNTNVHILRQQIKVINYEGYIQNKLVVLIFFKTI